jgi:hypothetical protein
LLSYTFAGALREAIKAFPDRFASIRNGWNSMILTTRERQSLAIARSFFTALRPMTSRARAWHLPYTGGDLSGFDRLPAAFDPGTNGAFP